jgi:hypothetical protein
MVALPAAFALRSVSAAGHIPEQPRKCKPKTEKKHVLEITSGSTKLSNLLYNGGVMGGHEDELPKLRLLNSMQCLCCKRSCCWH